MSQENQPATTDACPTKPARLWLVWDIAVHVFVGIAFFAVIACPAMLLDIANNRLQQFGFDPVIRYGLKMAEYTLFGVDLFLFLVFLYKTGARAARSF